MKRFLIVDDEVAIGRLIRQVAEGCGYEAAVTSDPEAFMDAVAAREPDVIALDLSMPEVDGIELLRFLATARCRARILIISGFDPRVLETAGELGAKLGLDIRATLTKPLRVAELRAAIDSLEEDFTP
jgi:CheY-like chemotaxis protein